MAPAEFLAWLDGFLDGKSGLTSDQVATLRAKAEKLAPLKNLNFNFGQMPKAIGKVWV